LTKAAEKAAREAASPDYSKGSYGQLPMNQSHERTNTKFTKIKELSGDDVGMTITVIGRLHVSRPTGAKMLFITIRQQASTVQSILTLDAENISKQMLKWSTRF
jgi:aspartyl-tRNA synthetase